MPRSKTRDRSSLEYALLGLVDQEPATGYDLCQVFETTPMAVYSSSPGAIYPALKRLQAAALVESEKENAETMRPRRVYRLTADGLEALVEWARRTPTRAEVAGSLDELMLRFAFMGQLVGRGLEMEQSRRFLRTLAAQVEEHLEELHGHLRPLADADPPHGRLALESGIAGYETLLRWARRALGELGG